METQTRSVITDNTYQVILVTVTVVQLLMGLVSLAQEFNFFALLYLVAYLVILVLFLLNHRYLRVAVKTGALLMMLGSLIVLPLAAFLVVWAQNKLWGIVALGTAMFLIGLYLYRGSNQYIQTGVIPEDAGETEAGPEADPPGNAPGPFNHS